jgi:hypothetical protein
MKEFVELEHVNLWTEQEKEIFLERFGLFIIYHCFTLNVFSPQNKRFLLYPKRFHRISAGLANKSCADCVRFYYRTKKQVNYKQKMEEMRKQRSKKNRQRSAILCPDKLLSMLTKLTTRRNEVFWFYFYLMN